MRKAPQRSHFADMSDHKDMPLEAEFHTLRHVLPPGISGVDDQLLKGGAPHLKQNESGV